MRSSHGRNNRRHRGNKGQDEEPLLVSRVDEPRSESYSRSHQIPRHAEGYRVASTSNRPHYDTNRDASSSRSHRDANSWRPGDTTHVRYSYTPPDDVYHRGSRDEYDVAESRDSDAWTSRSAGDSHYSQSRDNWPQQYDHGYSASSYPEPSAWHTTTPASYDNRSNSYEHWPTDDVRTHPVDEHSHSRVPMGDRDISGWHQDERRDTSGHKWQNDSGWDARRRESRGKGWTEPNRWNTTLVGKKPAIADDRSWEPAPTWQPSGRSDPPNQPHQNGHRNGRPGKNAKGGKKNQGYSQPKRDWRNDDGNLNNWPKRDSYGPTDKATKLPLRRKHVRSSSRSRSRSPTESHYSRRSSRGRSRSRSVSPASKRRRRDSSPVGPRSRTPSERGRKIWDVQQDRAYSRSPATQHHHGSGIRRRSLSSTSSLSTSRSSSRSPTGRPRAVHRLPPATPIATISSPTVTRTSRTVSHKNGKHQSNGIHNARSDGSASRRNALLAQSSSIEEMPPPALIPGAHSSRSSYHAQDTPYSIPVNPETKGDPPSSTANRIATVRLAGFKPIGQTSSSLRRFFPGDDDDIDVASDVKPRATASVRPRSQRTSHKPQTSVLKTAKSSVPEEGRHDSESHGRTQRTDEDSIQRNSLHVSHHDFSPSPRDQSHQSSLAEPGPLAESRNDELENRPLTMSPPQTQHRTDGDSHEAAGVSTPSVGSRGELYAIVSQVGEGTFGKVYKARNTVTKVHVALKRIRMESERDGFPVTAMREIKLLQSLRHDNVIRLYEMMVSNGSVYMVFEYMDHDLTGVLSQTQFQFEDAHLKSLCHQMLAGLAYLHHKGVIHRDIKGSNILINNRGELKLADFGLARFYQKRRRTDYTNRVITLWYRPPELLFGATVYGPEVDMWSAGCIMLELFTKKPVFQGNDEIHQLEVIYKIIGTPTPQRWSGMMDLPWYELVKPKDVVPNQFRVLFQKWMSPAALDLAERLLAYNPSQRASALQAMDASYFTQEEPRAVPPAGLAGLEGEWHELETKRERAKKRRKTETSTQ